MEQRRLGRLEQHSSVLIYGGAALGSVSQQEADESIAFALESGINHFDTARSYGDSELRLGPWMSRIRDRIFLSTKTGQRSKDGAMREIHQSLERLRVDRVDLLQLHAIGDLEQLDLATGPGGALEAALTARDEGIVGAIGITGHGHQAPATHLEALRRYPFETVLTPLNHVLYRDAAYRRDFDALVDEIRRQDVGLMAIKSVARGPWQTDDRTHATWYQPFDQQANIDAAVAFVLSHEAVTGIATAGDIHLLPKLVQAVDRYRSMNEEEIDAILTSVQDYASPFVTAS